MHIDLYGNPLRYSWDRVWGRFRLVLRLAHIHPDFPWTLRKRGRSTRVRTSRSSGLTAAPTPWHVRKTGQTLAAVLGRPCTPGCNIRGCSRLAPEVFRIALDWQDDPRASSARPHEYDTSARFHSLCSDLQIRCGNSCRPFCRGSTYRRYMTNASGGHNTASRTGGANPTLQGARATNRHCNLVVACSLIVKDLAQVAAILARCSHL